VPPLLPLLLLAPPLLPLLPLLLLAPLLLPLLLLPLADASCCPPSGVPLLLDELHAAPAATPRAARTMKVCCRMTIVLPGLGDIYRKQ